MKSSAKPIRVYAFKGEQSHGYFDDHGKHNRYMCPRPSQQVASDEPFGKQQRVPPQHVTSLQLSTAARA